MGKTTPTNDEFSSLEKHPHGRGEDVYDPPHRKQLKETPPRAWGRRIPAVLEPAEGGNTPTGVGKTQVEDTHQQTTKKHPHGRGEDIKS